MRVLVIEDHPKLALTVAAGLRNAGMAVDVVFDGRDAIEHAVGADYDVIVLDRDLPGVHGDDVCRRLIADGGTARVLMLTAAGDVADRVHGLGLGADDYLPKPFALDELLARLRALLRRSGWTEERRLLRFDDLELDPVAHEVRRGARLIELTRTEFLLLELFLHHPRQVLTREQIFDRVWGYDFGPTSNSLEVYVGYLRRKTEAGGEPRLLHTVRGVGYVLRGPRP
jgi:two-component system response regulator MprA